jgi:hypothetical protein
MNMGNVFPSPHDHTSHFLSRKPHVVSGLEIKGSKDEDGRKEDVTVCS